MELSQEKGASIWLTARPIEIHGFALHKSAFRDALCIRPWPYLTFVLLFPMHVFFLQALGARLGLAFIYCPILIIAGEAMNTE